MKHSITGRRNFIKQAAGTGLFFAASPLAANPLTQKENNKDDKLRVVCVGAHPDDPESGCGGTLLLYQQAGHQVDIIYLTRGEAGIAGKTHDEAAAIRTKEAENACKILHATPHFFGQVDGNTHFDQESRKNMLNMLSDLRPDIVFTHWPIDSHPDHQVASLLVYQSWLHLNKAFPIFYFEVNFGFQSMQFHPDQYFDISRVAEQKRQALYAHISQDPDDIYFHHHLIMQQFRAREIGVKEAEAFIRLDAEEAAIL